MKGDKLAHATNGHLNSCPVHAIMHRVLHIKLHHAPGKTPLHIFFNGCVRCQAMSYVMITSILHAADLTITAHAGVHTCKIAASFLHNSGATALLLGGVESDKI